MQIRIHEYTPNLQLTTNKNTLIKVGTFWITPKLKLPTILRWERPERIRSPNSNNCRAPPHNP